MASSGATPAAPSIALRPHARERDAIRASESVAFPELVWAHFLRQRALRENGELHGPAEDEFRQQLDRFTAEHGPVINAYWCTREASAVAITEKPGERILGFLWRDRPNIRFHAATDWATRDASEISHALHTTETLAIRVSEVLSGTSERIAMQWLLSVGGFLLSVVDGAEKKVNRQELSAAARRSRVELAQVESYYDRAGEKTGRLVYFWGMVIGILVLALVAIPGALIFRLFGTYRFDDPAVRDFFVCYALGAIGAIVSVMMRMARKSGRGFVDYEVGRPSLRRVGSFRPIIGAVFGVVVFLALKSGLVQLQPGAEDQSAYFYATLAFVAGFSERRAMVLLGGAEKMLGGGGDDEGRDDSTSGPRRRADNGHAAGGPG
jgi:tetrahydromethanopterin S-methyltransferase subunit G